MTTCLFKGKRLEHKRVMYTCGAHRCRDALIEGWKPCTGRRGSLTQFIFEEVKKKPFPACRPSPTYFQFWQVQERVLYRGSNYFALSLWLQPCCAWKTDFHLSVILCWRWSFQHCKPAHVACFVTSRYLLLWRLIDGQDLEKDDRTE